MDIERLKELLESGAISQEEFDTLAKANDPDTDPAPNPDPEPEPEPESELARRARQQEIDRAMAKERKEKAELKRQLERLQKKVLSDEEQRQLEIEQQKQELEEQRRELMLERNKMYAVKAMKKANISDSEEAMLLVEKMVAACSDETDIDDMIILLKTWKDKDVAAEVDRRFKSAGYTPKSGSDLNGGKNPWMKDQWNITEQMRITVENPELAAKLEAQAGNK